MIASLGLLIAFLGSFADAGYRTINQHYKIDPSVLSIYRGLGLALVMMPFLLFVPHPTNPIFYLLVIANGMFASVSSRKNMEIVNEYGANIASKFLTIPPVLVALLWWIIRPATFATFVNDDPFKAGGALFCLVGMLFTIFALGRNKYTKEALTKSVPIFFCYVAQTFLCFFAMKEASALQGMFYYVCLQGFVIGVLNYIVHTHHLKGHVKDQLLKSLFSKKILKAGLMFIFAMILARCASTLAFKLSPNPSYVVLIGNLQIIWIYFLSKFLKVENTVPPAKGVILVIYAITFIILTY